MAGASDPCASAPPRIGWSGVGETTAALGGSIGSEHRRLRCGEGATGGRQAADDHERPDCAGAGWPQDPRRSRIHPTSPCSSCDSTIGPLGAMCQSTQSRDGAAARQSCDRTIVVALGRPIGRSELECGSKCCRPLEVLRALPGDLDRTACSGLIDGLPGGVQIQRERIRVHAVGLVDVARPRCGGHGPSGARSHIRSHRRPRSTSRCSMDRAVLRGRGRTHPAGSRSTARRPGSGYCHTRTASRHRQPGRFLAGEVDVAGQRVRVHAVGLVDVARPRCGGHARGSRSRIRSRRRPWSTSSCSMDVAVLRGRGRTHPAGSRSTARRPGSGYCHTRTASRHRQPGRWSGR